MLFLVHLLSHFVRILCRQGRTARMRYHGERGGGYLSKICNFGSAGLRIKYDTATLKTHLEDMHPGPKHFGLAKAVFRQTRYAFNGKGVVMPL